MGETKKIVLDTNIVISGFGWRGNPHRILIEIMEGKLHWIISEEQLNEIKRVIQYSHLKFTEKQKTDIIAMVYQTSTIITIENQIKVILEDLSDNMLLDIALAAEADYLISGDAHLLKLKIIRKTRILKPTSFVEEIILHKSPKTDSPYDNLD